MGVDLKFETTAFQKAVEGYQVIIEDMNAIKEDLEKELEELQETHWNSEAGKEFQKQYSDTWKKNVETYTDFLTHLSEDLKDVESQYQALYERAKNLNIS